jgi:hypothetical protein
MFKKKENPIFWQIQETLAQAHADAHIYVL